MASTWRANGYVYLLLVISILLLTLVVLTWKRRRSPGSRYLAYLLAAAGLWSVTYAVQLGFQDLEQILFWAKARYVWIALVPAFWYLFASSFSKGYTIAPIRVTAILGIEPLLSNILIWSSSGDLFMEGVGLVQFENVVFIDFIYGPFFWVHSLYAYLMIAAGSVILARALLVKRDLYRGQMWMLGAGILAPWIGNALSIFEILPTPQFDVTPFTLLITGLAMLLGLYRFQLLDLLPVALETIFVNMKDGVIVLDAGKRITDSNPAVQRILGMDDDLPSGSLFHKAVPQLAEAISFPEAGEERREELSFIIDGDRRDIDIQTASLESTREGSRGWLISLHDITPLKKSEAALRDRARQISILNEISANANKIDAVESLLRKLAEQLLILMEADSCVIVRSGSVYSGRVFARVSNSQDSEDPDTALEGMEAEAVDRVLETGDLVVVQNGAGELEPGIPPKDQSGQIILGVPMFSTGETLGVVLVSYHNRLSIDADLYMLYEHAVEQITLALGRAVLLEELETRVSQRTAALKKANLELEEEISQRIYYERELSVKARDLEMNQLDIIWRLANAGEFRDNETGNHVVRVGYYSWLLARQIGLNEAFCRMIFLTSPLHDIGKIGIPDEILMSDAALTESERIHMKEHCLIGANILMSNPKGYLRVGDTVLQPPVDLPGVHVVNPFIEMAASIALSHHEKWDGSGYPMAIAGEDIPMEARIVSVADVFDALMSRRRYKPAFSVEESVAIIQKGSGVDFDPRVVNAFNTIMADLAAVHKQFGD